MKDKDEYLKTIFITVFIFITLFLILYIYMINRICNSKESLEKFIYTSPNFSKDIHKTILIIGATHGNEPSGYYATKKLMDDLNSNKIKLDNGRLILIPALNYCALKMNLRFIPFIGDMNRKYPTKINEKPSNKIIKQIVDLIDESDFVLDFHEGFDYNRKNSNSMGSTFTPTNNKFSLDLAYEIVDDLNKTINENYKKFRIFTLDKNLTNNDSDIYQKQNEIKGALSYYTNLINKNYILVETSGQDDITSLEERVGQDNFIIDYIIKTILK